MNQADFDRNFADRDDTPVFGPELVALVVPQSGIVASRFIGWEPEDELPVRKWLYGKHLIRGYVSLDVAAGGVGKTALKVGEALAMASGRPIYNKELPEGALRVWLYNLEDSADELKLRIRAAAKYHRISKADVGDRLYVDSGFDQPCIIATQTSNGTMIAMPVKERLISQIVEQKIDVLTLDPFVSSHSVSENDNMAIDLVMKKGFADIAYRTGCAINLVHHVTKPKPDHDVSADSARGASALIGAVRSAQVYNRMNEDEAARADIKPEQRPFYFRVTSGKANLAPPSERADWYRLESVDLDNGEKVGVVAQFVWPALKVATTAEIDAIHAAVNAGRWRDSSQCSDWVGNAIGPVLGLDPTDKDARKRIAQAVASLLKAGHLEVRMEQDARRHMKPFILSAQGVE